MLRGFKGKQESQIDIEVEVIENYYEVCLILIINSE